ncbi:hypothetical protein [Pseudomonas sp. R37(2017)]|uniref:hypothetical protein n=1 Tax=Pseudomonas sp. R37(2017) TaxID=1981685 RepID=UPI002114CC80|nr:hypothetical protein [Pseudomonas sp. R37(2017)]
MPREQLPLPADQRSPLAPRLPTTPLQDAWHDIVRRLELARDLPALELRAEHAQAWASALIQAEVIDRDTFRSLVRVRERVCKRVASPRGRVMSGRDGHDPFAAYNLPAAVHAQALKLLVRIAQADTPTACLRAADRAEGFVLGLETVKALNAASLEALYVAFDNAATARQLELEQ